MIIAKLMESWDIFSMRFASMIVKVNTVEPKAAAPGYAVLFNPADQHSIVRGANDKIPCWTRLNAWLNSRLESTEGNLQMAYTCIAIETQERVGIVRLDRPKALNALNAELMTELCDALRKFDKDEQIGCIILTGNEKAFAAGADIKQMQPKSFVDVFREDFFTPEVEAINGVRKPIIAAVAGYALGGGCELAMMCDFILAAENAKFGQPEINLGVIPGIGGTQRLTRFVGKSKSMEMNLTGRFMDAEEAERAGLVSRILPLDDLMDEAISVAGKIADKGPLAVMAIKESVNRSYETTLAEGVRFERRLFYGLFATEDKREGMEAFIEKREAKFKGQ